jgi:hypothetical protein
LNPYWEPAFNWVARHIFAVQLGMENAARF